MSSEYIFEINDVLYDHETGKACMKPKVVGALIRCKDCKWFGEYGCAIRIVDDSDKPKENDYCSFAERRSDDAHKNK